MIHGSKYFKKELERNGFSVKDHSYEANNGTVYYTFEVRHESDPKSMEYYSIEADSHFTIRETVATIIADYKATS